MVNDADETTPLLVPSGSALPNDVAVTREPGSKAVAEVEEESVSEDPEAGSDDQAGITFTSPVMIVSVLTIGVFIAQLDTSFVLATHSNIASEFARLEDSSWIIASYALAMSATQPIYGKLSDIYGRKGLLMGSYTFFAIGCGICGLAQSMGVLIAGRVIGGIGGAGTQALVSLLILDLFPIREVASLRSYVNIAATTGRSLGGPVGGFLADTIGWRWSFLGQCPLIMLSAILVLWLVPRKRKEEDTESKGQRFRRIDFAGSFLLAVAITSFLTAVEIGGQKFPWTSPIVLGLFGAGAASAGLFIVVEEYWAPEPVFPLRLLWHREVVCGYLVLGLQLAAQMGLMFCVPLYFQVAQSASAEVAGAHLMPAVIGNAVGALMAGIIIKRTGRYKLLAAIATLSAASCYLTLMLRWHGDTNFWESLEIIPGGFGTGMAEAAVFISLSAGVDQSLHGIALSGLFLAASIGMIGGLAGSSAVLQTSLQNELRIRLDGLPDRDTVIRKALSDIEYVLRLKGDLHDIVIGAWVRALEYTHAVSLACTCVAFLVSLFIKQRRL